MWQRESEESWTNHTTSPPADSCVLPILFSRRIIRNSSLLCWESDLEEEDSGGCRKMLTIQEEIPSVNLSRRAKMALRRWLRRRYTFKTFTNQSLAVPKDSTNTSSRGFWRWLTLRCLLLHGSRQPHPAGDDQQQMSQSACQSVQPSFIPSPTGLRSRCFSEEEELVLPLREDQRPSSEIRQGPAPAREKSETFRQSERREDGGLSPVTSHCAPAAARCNIVFRVLRHHTAPELRHQYVEESNTDLQRLLDEDEDEDDDSGEGSDTGIESE